MKFNKRQGQESKGTNKYLSFADGETKNLILRGEVYEFYHKWVNGKGQETSSNDPEGRVRFRVNAICSEGTIYVVKIWEFPMTIYSQLGSINDEYPLEKTVLKVTRSGVGTETVYHILPLLKMTIPAAVEKLELHILNNKPKSAPTLIDKNFPEIPMPEAEDELPF